MSPTGQGPFLMYPPNVSQLSAWPHGYKILILNVCLQQPTVLQKDSICRSVTFTLAKIK